MIEVLEGLREQALFFVTGIGFLHAAVTAHRRGKRIKNLEALLNRHPVSSDEQGNANP